MEFNNNYPEIYDSTNEYNIYNEYMNDDVFMNRYNNRNDNRYDNRFDNRYDNRYNNMYDYYNRPYDRNRDDYYRRMRYYQYPYCDRYGRCDNQLWWLFWPFFFL